MSEKNNKFITGILDNDADIRFFIDNYQVTFLSKAVYTPVGQNDIEYIIPDESGFIYGKTYSGHNIAIYIQNKISLVAETSIRTPCYIISDGNVNCEDLNCFSGIQFVGGIMNSLYKTEPLKLVSGFNNEGITYKYNDDFKKIRIYDERGGFDLCIGAGIKWNYDSGISKDDVVAILEFEQEQPVKRLFDFYNNWLDICKFLTFRNRVGFSAIKILTINKSEGLTECIREATVYIWQDKPLYERDFYRIIPINILTDDNLNKLYSVVSSHSKRKPHYQNSYYPESSNVYIITNERLRNICSAIEAEMALIKQEEFVDSNYKSLIKQLKDIIKEHRDGEHPLSKKTYDFMFGDINHWTMALSERIYRIYEMHQEKITKYLENMNRFTVSEEKIDKMVKYRNDVTHGNFAVLDEDIGGIALVVIALIYCCILKRIGVDDMVVKGLFDKGLLLY